MNGPTELLLAAAVAFAGWLVSVRLWPTRRCPSCKGTGKNAGSNSLRWGTCRRCKGERSVTRFGAKRD